MKKSKNIKQNNALILFTRVPVPGQTKTRMMPYYTPEQCAEFHCYCVKDIVKAAVNVDAEIIVSYTGGKSDVLKTIISDAACYCEQVGDDLGERMYDAIEKAFGMGYEKVVLVGTDVPELRAETIDSAFETLDSKDLVIGPTEDGGYYLIGMKTACKAAFNVKKYSTTSVFEETVKSIEEDGKSIAVVDTYTDIDEPDDLLGFRQRMRSDVRLRHSNTAKYVADNTKVSIIIPTYNEESMAERMRLQLLELRDDAEIIFVDGGSTDRTLEIIGDEFKAISAEKCRGKQMNIGAQAAGGDVLFFLHCDSELPSKALAEIRRCIARYPYGCFGVKYESRNFFMWTNKLISNHRAWSRGLPFGDQGIFIDRDLFFKVGMFPEQPVMEDYEFSLNMRKAGYRPGATAKRIVASDRRYEKGTKGILKTEFLMWNLRRKYRKGNSAEEIAEKYGDIR